MQGQTHRQIQIVNCVYKTVRKCGDSADGAVVGLNGSVTASSLVKILNSIHVPGHAFADLGAGDGRVILSALAMGANKAVGFELPENLSHCVLFCAARHMLQSRLQVEGVDWALAEWTARDINTLGTLDDDSYCIFSFWVGMPFDTQKHILFLCNSCSSVKEFAVFRDRKWTNPQDGL